MMKKYFRKNKFLYAFSKLVYFSFLRRLLIFLPREIAHKILYRVAIGKKLDLKKTKDLNQKIHYLIVYKLGDREALLLDKYTVKQYLKELNIADLHVAKLFEKYDSTDQIDLDKLPDKFVLKTTHGNDDTEICLDKSTFDLQSAKIRLKKALKQNMSKDLCEYFSINVTKAILCEEYIDDFSGINPIDYKIYCIHGIARCIMVYVGRRENSRHDCYDTNWNRLDWCVEENRIQVATPKPANLQRMIEIAEELTKPFPLVRLDLYNANGKIYFGEFTFTSFDGNIRDLKQCALDELGSLLVLK